MKIDHDSGARQRTITLRDSGPADLADGLVAGRKRLLELFAAYRAALGEEMRVPLSSELNLPLWELGHIGWFEEYWIARNQHYLKGLSADQDVIARDRGPSCIANADGLYDSSNVAHDSRWQLDLPSVVQTQSYLAQVREDTLDKLRRITTEGAEQSDDALYFFRLARFHEAMHREAWIYMAQALGISLDAVLPGINPVTRNGKAKEIVANGGHWLLGSTGSGFAFDNELSAHQVSIANFEIDSEPVTWRRFLEFVDAGGYEQMQWWSAQGREWMQRQPSRMPRYLRIAGSTWQRNTFGIWQDLVVDSPAMNLSLYEAQAWCRWAGRRLPTEAEWEMMACTQNENDFAWGEVWEWTASPFTPYPGFVTHPYRDYSAPWFDGRPVLRGASFATDSSMRHPRYRNFFTSERNDIFAGFRSCAK
jgi:gamma-glutamyl hercynylcysteine S-oxide synthase